MPLESDSPEPKASCRSHSRFGRCRQKLKTIRVWRRFVLLALALAVGAFLVLSAWLLRLDQNIKQRFAEKRFAPPVEFYSAPEAVRAGHQLPPSYLENLFARKNYRKRRFGQPLQAGDYSIWSSPECQAVLPISARASTPPGPATSGTGTGGAEAASNTDPAWVPPESQSSTTADIDRCIAFRTTAPPTSQKPPGFDPSVQIIAFSSTRQVLAVFKGDVPARVDAIDLEPELFAQYYGESPVLRQVVELGQTPTNCLNALLAIEDSTFLEHSGVSFTGLLRATWTNLRAGRKAQGGSTITQQLVKNYFLTDEKTLRRKLTEIPMAFLVERRASKDEILETYINLIYMGQNGPFQVRGFAAAAEHYFGRGIGGLSLDQCALLAAVLNSPGLYNPFKHPERARKRRSLVLDRMAKLNMITSDEALKAKAAPLPSRPKRHLTEPAPYFIQAVRRELERREIDGSEGLRVYTTLNLRAQEAAHLAVRDGLERLEEKNPYIRKLKMSGKNLEAVLVAAEPKTGAVQALVGGRGYLATQFNRAIDSRRQVGSIMKPFVYLTAFESLTEGGRPYTPLTLLRDEPKTYRFDGQTWTPRNYDGKYRGEVPLYIALTDSLNAATVDLGMRVGLDTIVDTTRRLGINSKVSALPSLTLGAFELSPLEVLQAYSTLAQFGRHVPLVFIERVNDLDGKTIYHHAIEPRQVTAPEPTAQLVGIMKNVLTIGTARSVTLAGFTRSAAGKTGTTNDKKDAWFAGFTPDHAALVWIGYDDNTSVRLTGSSGAVPIWTRYMKSYAASLPAKDFPWPESMEAVQLGPGQTRGEPSPVHPGIPTPSIELIFRKGQTALPLADE